MRISLLDCTGRFAAPVRGKKQIKQRSFVPEDAVITKSINSAIVDCSKGNHGYSYKSFRKALSFSNVHVWGILKFSTMES